LRKRFLILADRGARAVSGQAVKVKTRSSGTASPQSANFWKGEMKESRMQYRIFGVWRLIAAFLVMAYHFCHYAPVNREAVIAWFERLMPLLDMFFMVSGVLIYQRYSGRVLSVEGYKTYLIRRIARLYPLHILTTGFFVIVGLGIMGGLIHSNGAEGGMQRYDWGQLPSNLLLIQAWGVSDALTFNYVSWSISAEWFCYLLLPLIAFADRRGGAAGMALLLAAVLIALETLVSAGIMPYESWMKASTWGAYRAFADFIIGAIIIRSALVSDFSLKSPWPAWALIIISCIGMQVGWAPYLSLFLIATALFLAAVSEKNAPRRSAWLDIFSPLTAVSFGIYLWHPIYEALLISFGWRKFIEPSGLIGFYPFLVLPMALTALTAWLSYFLLEKRITSGILALAGMKRPEKAPDGAPANA
jgi:peptidoglycan/LPS O-acetylase OafA/YrhL